jgi:hypothetical protein
VFDWLFEGRQTVYVVLAAAAVVLLVAWWQTRKRYWLIGAGAMVGLIGLYFLLDRLVETDREQVVRKVQEMAAAVKARNIDGIFTHVSDEFRLDGLDKASFRNSAEQAIIRLRRVEEVEVWDFHVPSDFRSPHESRVGGSTRPTQVAQVGFQAKPKGKGPGLEEGVGYPCEARFVRDPDGQWRLLDFQVFKPVSDTKEPLPIPQLLRQLLR